MVYGHLAEVAQACIIDLPHKPPRSASRYIKQLREKRERETLTLLDRLRKRLLEEGIESLLPTVAYSDHPLKYLPIAFSVHDPVFFEDTLMSVLKVLADIDDLADIFWLVPIHGGTRFMTAGYRISVDQILQIVTGKSDQWEVLTPNDLPQAAYELLPRLPYKENPRFQLLSSLLMLLGILRTHETMQEVVHGLLISDNRFIKQLGEIEFARLHELRSDLHEKSIRARTDLEALYASRCERLSYMTIVEFTNQVEAAFKNVSTSDQIVSISVDENQIDNAITDLLSI